MITLSFSKAIVEGLEKELTRALGLNNLRLYKIVQGLLWVHEGKVGRLRRRLQVSASDQVMGSSETTGSLSAHLVSCQR